MQAPDKFNSLFFTIPTLIITSYIVVLFLPAFLNKGPLLQTDQPTWTATAHVWNEEVFPSQKWFCGTITDRAGAGLVLGRLYSMSLMLPWLLTNLCGTSAAIKLSTLISILLFTIAFFHLACRYMPNNYALLSSFVIITPVFDLLTAGMWYQYFSIGCAFIFWLSSERLCNCGTAGSAILAILSFALSIYSHPVGTMLCIAVWTSHIILYIFQNSIRPKLLFVLLIIPIVAILLAFPQVYTIMGLDIDSTSSGSTAVQHVVVTGPIETLKRLFFIQLKRVDVILPKTELFVMSINMLSVVTLFLIGVCSLFKQKKIDKLLPIISLILLTFVLISKIYNHFGLHIAALEGLSQFYYRFQALSQIYLVLMSGVGLSYLYQCSTKSKRNKTFFCALFVIMLISFAYIAAMTPKKLFIDRTEQLGTLETSVVYQDALTLWEWLNNNVVSHHERVYFEDTWRGLHWNRTDNPESYDTHILALTSMYTDISQINGWCGLTSKFSKQHEYGRAEGIFARSLVHDEISDEFIRNEMKLLNCTHIVAHTERTINRLKKVPFLKLVADLNTFSVFRNTQLQPAWAYNVETGNTVKLIKHSPAHYEVLAEGQEGDLIHISLAYYPNWTASWKGNEIPILNHRQLMQIHLPAEGNQTICFKYSVKRKIPILLMTAGIVLLFFVLNLLRSSKSY